MLKPPQTLVYVLFESCCITTVSVLDNALHIMNHIDYYLSFCCISKFLLTCPRKFKTN